MIGLIFWQRETMGDWMDQMRSDHTSTNLQDTSTNLQDTSTNTIIENPSINLSPVDADVIAIAT
jgi:hypothetical protein